MYIRPIETPDELFCFIYQIPLKYLEYLIDKNIKPRIKSLFDVKKYIVGSSLIVRNRTSLNQYPYILKIKTIDVEEDKRPWQKQKIVINGQFDMMDLFMSFEVTGNRKTSRIGWILTDEEVGNGLNQH